MAQSLAAASNLLTGGLSTGAVRQRLRQSPSQPLQLPRHSPPSLGAIGEGGGDGGGDGDGAGDDDSADSSSDDDDADGEGSQVMESKFSGDSPGTSLASNLSAVPGRR